MKNIILISFLMFICGCGYTSVYKNQKTIDFQINIIEMSGDNEFNNLIKNELKMYSNLNSENKYDVSVNSIYQKSTVSKNSAGVAIDYKLSANATISIYLGDKVKMFEFEENIKIKNNSNSFDQNVYERNIKKNFASSIREKFISKVFDLNDN